jgi:hypothetical protein
MHPITNAPPTTQYYKQQSREVKVGWPLARWAWTLARWDLAPWLSVVARSDGLTTVD